MCISKKDFERYQRACSQEEDRLLALVAEYKQDASRYRWLRTNFNNNYFLDHIVAIDAFEPLGADEVDAAIDAAMSAQAGGKEASNG